MKVSWSIKHAKGDFGQPNKGQLVSDITQFYRCGNGDTVGVVGDETWFFLYIDLGVMLGCKIKHSVSKYTAFPQQTVVSLVQE